MKIPPVFPYSLALVGGWLAYTAVRNESPVDVLRGVLSGNRETPRQLRPTADSSSLTATAGVTVSGAAAAVSAATAGTPALVKIGQGGHQLAPAAAAAFARWQTLFGRTITITDSYRSAAQQASGYAKDPGRFASPEKSRHVRGEAVDVNLQALGAAPPVGGKGGNAVWQSLYSAATAAGWCNPRGPYRGDHKEPWHFSFNGCG